VLEARGRTLIPGLLDVHVHFRDPGLEHKEGWERGSAGALHGWCQSSGHHRNLLFESHTEMGGAEVGPYWTENFGGAREYRGNLVH